MGNRCSNNCSKIENIYEEAGHLAQYAITTTTTTTTTTIKSKSYSLLKEEKSRERHRRFTEFIKCVKIFVYLLAFVLILISSILSKSTIILMSSMISVNRSILVETFVTDNRNNNMTTINNSEGNGIFEANDAKRIEWLWCLFFVVIVPELVVFFRSLRFCLFKHRLLRPKYVTIITVIIAETLSSIGVALLIFLIMPTMDSLNCVLISNTLCFIPALLKLFSERENNNVSIKIQILDTVSFVIQIIGLIAWPIIVAIEGSDRYISLPIALILISFLWFDNFLNLKFGSKCHSTANTIKFDLRSHTKRYSLYLFVSLWKIVVVFTSMILIEFALNGSNTVHNIFLKLLRGFDNNDTINNPNESKISILCLLLLQICASYLCYAFSLICCKIGMNSSFSLANVLTVPFSIAYIVTMHETNELSCLFPSLHYADWFFTQKHMNSAITYAVIVVSILTYSSQIWTTIYIWSCDRELLNPREKIFHNPTYSALFIDQSLSLNRKQKDEKSLANSYKLLHDSYSFSESEFHFSQDNDWCSQPIEFKKVINIIACVTLWHENRKEMTQMVESLMKLDCDQLVKQLWPLKSKCFNKLQPYKLEVNVFFDDAFETVINQSGDEVRVCNKYVHLLTEVLDTAAAHVYKFNLKMRPMNKMHTPYGGRLEWLMPGETKFIVHLKDSEKIRSEKRWSKFMCMSFLLEHRVRAMNHKRGNTDIGNIRNNTFVLALDGDTSFLPRSLELLVGSMLKNEYLGAVCGRIHPNECSSGPIAWYQKFEYAIRHWLQKSSEHVFGSVLCSTGCFSLYRLQALLDVMDDYSRQTTNAIHKLQYDFGEDRWLSTLLLKNNWNVEYSAAADAYTFVTETFSEYIHQQIRWKVSTFLNIIDLLRNRFASRKYCEMSNVCLPYALFLTMLAISTFLTPGTMFLMIVGAMDSVLRIKLTTSLIINVVTIFSFALICSYCSNEKIKIHVTLFISLAYGLFMLAMLLSPLFELNNNVVFYSSAVLFPGLIVIIIIAALLHPQEYKCILQIIFYVLLIPYTFLFLPIFALTHLHNPKWGTRDDNYDTKMPTLLESSVTCISLSNNSKKRGENISVWSESEKYDKFRRITISEEEKSFWCAKLEEKLDCKHSLDNDLSKNLEKLKEKSLLIFGCINALFVLFVYLLQTYFVIRIPCGQTYTFIVDPIGVVLIIFFGLITIVQFVAMLVHRFETLLILLAVNEIDFFKKSKHYSSDEEYIYAINTINRSDVIGVSEYSVSVMPISVLSTEEANLKTLIKNKLNFISESRLLRRHRRKSSVSDNDSRIEMTDMFDTQRKLERVLCAPHNVMHSHSHTNQNMQTVFSLTHASQQHSNNTQNRSLMTDQNLKNESIT